MQEDAEGETTDVQQLKLELAGYQSCCKQLGQELVEKDRELEGQSDEIRAVALACCLKYSSHVAAAVAAAGAPVAAVVAAATAVL